MPLNPQPKTLNPATLLSLFDRVAEAPSAIPRLRQFILDLAVRGKLVEPGAPSPFASLSNLCTSRSGNGKMIKGTLSATPGEGLYPCYSASGQDVWHDHFDHDGDAVIVSAVGARCGKAFVATGKWSAIANTHILFPKAEVCSLPYLHLIANNEALWIRGGSAQPFVKVAATLQDRKVYLPPLAEQHRIVAKVDELMALCDRLETAQAERETRRTRLLASTHASLSHSTLDPRHSTFFINTLPRLTTSPTDVPLLRQTILNLAVVGKLTDNQLTGPAAAEELKAIESKKQELALRKPKKVPPLAAEEQWTALPNGWAWARWEQIADWITYGFTRPMPHETDGIPIVTGKNVNNGRIIFETAHKTTNEAYAELSDKDRPKSGDILVTKDGSIGRSAVVDTRSPFCINQSVAVLWLRSCHFNRRFLQLVIDCPRTQQAFLAKTEGVAIKHISVVDLGKMVLPLPPLAEQHRIVAKVDELMALCDRLEAQLTTTQTQSRRLLESTLHHLLAA